MTGPDLVTGQDHLTGQDRAGACHQMLLRLAGRVPDALLTRSRHWLARGDLGSLARSVAFSVASQDVALAEADAILLAALLGEADADPSGLSELTLDDVDPFPYYAFAAQVPAELAGSAAGDRAAGDPAAGPGAAADRAAAAAAAAEPGVLGLWRAWRFPPAGAPWPPPRRVFVVELQGPGEPAVAARLQDRVAAAGEPDPQVEVYRSGTQLPLYTELARSYGELLWAAASDPGIRLAAVFDEVDAATGPRFRPDHPCLDSAEAARVAAYLQGGEPLLMTAELMDDVVDSAQADCVPMSFRTDGTWIWTEAAAYYAQQYRLEPDPGLLAHLRERDYALPPVDGIAVHRALQVLQEDAELEWEPAADPARAPAPDPWDLDVG